MVSIGYGLMSEEHSAPDLVRNAVRAEQAGFSFATLSDHFHPWLDSQGQSPFAWSTLGALAQATESMILGTGVTCPTVRVHPAIIAQATATMGTLAPGRFFLGVGSGENLNEHVTGEHWPAPAIRLRMLDEAIEVIRELWTGEQVSFEGEFYTVDRARIYSLPESLPPIIVAASGRMSGEIAAHSGDGLMATSPNEQLVRGWREAGGEGPRIGLMHLVYAPDEDSARRTLAEHWSHAPLSGSLNAELRTPSEFMAASKFIRLEDYSTESTPLGPDPEPVVERIRAYERAGYDHVVLHQVGPDQEGFIRFFEEELKGRLNPERATIVPSRGELAPA